MEDCVFCKIIKGEIPTDFIKKTDNFVVFKDIKPSAPVHLLIVSQKHFEDISKVSDELWVEVRKIAMELGREFSPDGYRVGNNAGNAALVKHFHVHFLGGVKSDRSI